jgi:hypothetical protein
VSTGEKTSALRLIAVAIVVYLIVLRRHQRHPRSRVGQPPPLSAS